jgi:hypothetical protein
VLLCIVYGKLDDEIDDSVRIEIEVPWMSRWSLPMSEVMFFWLVSYLLSNLFLSCSSSMQSFANPSLSSLNKLNFCCS